MTCLFAPPNVEETTVSHCWLLDVFFKMQQKMPPLRRTVGFFVHDLFCRTYWYKLPKNPVFFPVGNYQFITIYINEGPLYINLRKSTVTVSDWVGVFEAKIQNLPLWLSMVPWSSHIQSLGIHTFHPIFPLSLGRVSLALLSNPTPNQEPPTYTLAWGLVNPWIVWCVMMIRPGSPSFA